MWTKKRFYFDYAASAPTSVRARHAFDSAASIYGNPSSTHAEGVRARTLLEDARTRIARLAGTKADAVIVTSGATEGNAIAIHGHLEARIKQGQKPGSMHVLYLASQHASVQGSMERLASLGVQVEAFNAVGGHISLTEFKKKLRRETVLVSVDVVCGETGAIYKVRDLRRVLDQYKEETGTTIYLHADASQAPSVESFELEHLGADVLTLDAQKVGGVRGVGVLIAPRRIPLAAIVEGGGQERGIRPGTEPVALVVAFATALEDAHQARASFRTRSQELRAQLLRGIKDISNVVVNEGKEQAPHILNLSFLGRDTDYLAVLLDEAGFAVSTKSACETKTSGSRAVRMMTGDEDRARTTLRISWGPQTTQSEVAQLSRALVDSVRFIDAGKIY